MTDRELDQLRCLALALPEVNERLSHGAPSFFLRDRRPICYFHSSEFSSDGRTSIWCPAPPGIQEELVAADPATFFAPTPSSSGVLKAWVGIYLDAPDPEAIDWQQVAEVLEDAYRHVAPKKLIALLEQRRQDD